MSNPANEKLNSLLALKLGVAGGEYRQEDIMAILTAFRTGEQGNSFRDHKVQAKDKLTGRNIMVDGFTLSQTLPLSTARMLTHALRVSSTDFKFPVKIKMERVDDKTAIAHFTTKDDYAPYLMDDPRNIAAINVENMANYSIARSLVKSLAYANAYQFDPEMQYMPFPPSQEAKPRRLEEHVSELSSSYIGTHKSITSKMDERFTVRDVLDIKATFRDGLARIKSIGQSRSLANAYPRQTVANSPTFNPDPENEKARVRPGF